MGTGTAPVASRARRHIGVVVVLVTAVPMAAVAAAVMVVVVVAVVTVVHQCCTPRLPVVAPVVVAPVAVVPVGGRRSILWSAW